MASTAKLALFKDLHHCSHLSAVKADIKKEKIIQDVEMSHSGGLSIKVQQHDIYSEPLKS